MRQLYPWAWAALALLMAAAPATATSPVAVVMGPSRDGPLQELQSKVDRLVGPGRVDVRADYIGAHPRDPDPWFWVNNETHVISVTLIDRKSPHGVVGWYEETNAVPVIDGVADGLVLDSHRVRGMRTSARIPAAVAHFGFYVEHQGGDEAQDEGRSYRYFTNRSLNDRGLHGGGAVHEPYDGDVQALVFDVSRWLGPDTWLVACEYSDSGCRVGMDGGESDNDYSDILFTVTATGGTATSTRASTFTHVKSLYR